MYSQLYKAQQKHQVALEVLSYHCCVMEKETEQCVEAASASALPNDFYRYAYKESVFSTLGRSDKACIPTIVLLQTELNKLREQSSFLVLRSFPGIALHIPTASTAHNFTRD